MAKTSLLTPNGHCVRAVIATAGEHREEKINAFDRRYIDFGIFTPKK
jgi:hypothetical protein